MTIYGREVGFFFSTWAKFKIAELPKDLNLYEQMAKSAAILSEAYEARQKYMEPGHKGTALTEDVIRTLNDDEFSEMCTEVNKALEEGQKVTVEVDGKKKEGKASS